MILRNDDALRGIDDFVAEIALARRARLHYLANTPTLCGRRFTHLRRPQLDARGYLLIVTCACLQPGGHDDNCVCEHGIERRVYRVDHDGREHYVTRPLGATPCLGDRGEP
jgi:hypothetical protein